MDVLRYASFSRDDDGGNPAGVVLLSHMPSDDEMQAVAAEVGYSETAFALPVEGGNQKYRVRYFTPTSEVPFCGHATIALGAALAEARGSGVYDLVLNEAEISVEGQSKEGELSASLTSPETFSEPVPEDVRDDILALFGLSEAQFDPALAPAFIHGGARHLIFALRTRQELAQLTYEAQAGAKLMQSQGLITVVALYRERETRFHARNFGAGVGIYEDPATGAAAAALAGHLHRLGRLNGDSFTIFQGDDMSMPSTLRVRLSGAIGAPVQVSGQVRRIEDA